MSRLIFRSFLTAGYLLRRHSPSLILLFLALLFVLMLATAANASPPSLAAVLTVTTTDDLNSPNPGCTNPCSLRQAIDVANNTSGPITVQVPEGSYVLTHGELAVGTFAGANITIIGTGSLWGAPISPATGSTTRVFHINPGRVSPGVSVSLRNLGIVKGNNPADLKGGAGILVDGAGNTLSIVGSMLGSNTLDDGFGYGGGIEMAEGGTLTIDSSTFQANQARGMGGAIDYVVPSNQSGSLSVSNSSFDLNEEGLASNVVAWMGGGAIHVSLSAPAGGVTRSVTIASNQFLNNRAWTDFGGALMLANNDPTTPMQVHFNRFYGNQAVKGHAVAQATTQAGMTYAQNNWWGCNEGPTAQPTTCDGISGGVVDNPPNPPPPGSALYQPWLVLKASSSPSWIYIRDSATFAADLTHNVYGDDTSALGSIAPFTFVGFDIPAGAGTVNPPSALLTNGKGSTTFTADGLVLPLTLSAVLDNAKVKLSFYVTCRNTVTVTSSLDSGAGSLREAVGVVCDGGTVNFAGDYTITLLQKINPAKDVTIDGTGHAVTISGNTQTRVFEAGSPLTLKHLIITNGSTVENDGGGALVNYDKATIIDSTFTNNRTTLGGGAISNSGASAELDVENSTFSDNNATLSGGAIFNSGTLTVKGSTFTNNTGGILGGAIATLDSTTSDIETNTFTGNQSASGGAVAIKTNGSANGNHTLTGNTFVGNGAGKGGGLYNEGIATLTNNTLVNNTATVNGGGIANFGTLTAYHNTLFGNSSTPAGSGGGMYLSGAQSLYSNIVAASSSGSDCAFGNGGFQWWTSLDSDGSCQVGVWPGNLSKTNPKLAPLANNGGPTQTMLPLPGSPVIDHAGQASCPAVDQRGAARVVTVCDIGAVEVRGFRIVKSGDNQTAGTNAPYLQPLQVTLTETGGGPIQGAVFNYSTGTSPEGATALLSAATATTDANGVASVKATANDKAGVFTVQALAGTGATAEFSLTNANVKPTSLTLTNASITAGGKSTTLTVNGKGFVNGAVILWNGNPLPTTYVSPTQLIGKVAASLIARAGTVQIQVINPPPNLGASAPIVLTLTVPKIRSDLKIIKTLTRDTKHKLLIYTLLATNPGPSPAQNVSVTDILPTQVAYQSVTSTRAGSSCAYHAATRTIACTAPTLQVGASFKILIAVKWVGGSGTAKNCADVNSSTYDTSLTNNESCVIYSAVP